MIEAFLMLFLTLIPIFRYYKPSNNRSRFMENKTKKKIHFKDAIYHQLLQSMMDGFIFTDMEGIILESNKAFQQILGYTDKELRNLTYKDITPEKWHPAEIKIIEEQILSRGYSDVYEKEYRKKDGTIIPVELRTFLFKNDKGETEGIWAIVRDISERDNLIKARKTSEINFINIAEQASDGIFIVVDGIIKYCNPALAKMGGYTIDELIGTSFLDYIHPDFIPVIAERYKRRLAGEDIETLFETQLLYKNGTYGDAEINISFIGYNGGKAIMVMVRDITERKHTEEIINQQHATLQGILESSSSPIFSVDVNYRYTSFNKSHAEIMKQIYDVQIELGKSILEYQSVEKDRLIAKANIDRALNGESHIQEAYSGDAKHARLYFEVSHNPIIYLEHNIVGTAVIARDLTSRKLAEEALKDNEERLNNLIANLPGLVYRCKNDRNWTMEYLSDSCKALLGYEVEDFIEDKRLSYNDIIHPDDRERIWNEVQEAIGRKDKYELNYRVRTKDGVEKSVWEKGTGIYSPDGELIALEGFIQDITDIRQAEKALLESEKKYKDIVKWAPIGIYQSTPDGDFITVNASLVSMLGYQSVDDLIKNNIKDCYYNYDEREKLITQYDNPALGSVTNLEVYWKKKDGKPISILLSAHAIRDDEGNTKYYEGFVLDITERKSLEVQLLRTQRLDSLGTLASGIAHDLNNVLSPILLSIDMLKMYSPEEKMQKLLSTLEINAIRGRDIIKQVLTFARGFKSEFGILQPKHIMKDILNIAQETFPKNIQIISDIFPDLWTVKGDATQLHQVLMNLFLNARDAMPVGGTLELKALNFISDRQFAKMQLQAHEGAYIIISIRDTGEGIPYSVIEKIFDPFFTTKEIGKGTGLGLSTSHTIVRGHGGFIEVKSEVGKGTIFDVYLPAVEETSQNNKPMEKIKLVPGKGEGILIVDDEVSVLDIIKQTLELYGYNTFIAKDGIEGLAIYAQNRDKIDLVMIDLMMPVMDGIQMYNALRKFNAKIPVITMSGEKLDISSLASSLSGVGAHLQKPYTAEILLKTLREVLEK
ncbi:MAG: hypothetical protein C0417_13685 [Chlorobiaceae bacterium]|nr:hypothetical protein [Chlorobiaceae bacterium]